MESRTLDYSVIRREEDLLAWVEEQFPLKDSKREVKRRSPTQSAVFQIWGYLVENKIKHLQILESYPRHAAPEIKAIIEGGGVSAGEESWKSILGFHLYRDNLIHVEFIPNPETIDKTPNSYI